MNNDLFLYDTERLKSIASDDTVKQGLAYFSGNRVFALDVQDNILTAQVEDADVNEPYWVTAIKLRIRHFKSTVFSIAYGS